MVARASDSRSFCDAGVSPPDVWRGNTLVFDQPVDSNWFADDAGTTDNPLCQFIFTGRRYDPETSSLGTQIYFYRARYYHPQLGRSLSREPLGYADDMNRYEYVRSRPVVLLDPMGLQALTAEQLNRLESWIAGEGGTPLDGAEGASVRLPGGTGAGANDLPALVRAWDGRYSCISCHNPYTLSGMYGVLSYGQLAYLNSIKGESNQERIEMPAIFKMCKRLIMARSIIERLSNALGGRHTYIGYGDQQWSGTGAAPWGMGGAGPKKTSPAYRDPVVNPDKCVICHKSEVCVTYDGKEKLAIEATDAEIKKCIEKHPARKDFQPLPWKCDFYACQNWAYEAAQACGLYCPSV